MKKFLLAFGIVLIAVSCQSTSTVVYEEEEPVEAPVARAVDNDELVLPSETSIRYENRGKFLDVTPKVIFKFASTNMPHYAEESFSKVAEFMNSNPNVTVVIEAHTSNRGIAYPFNYELSVARAKNAKDYLVEKGISADRLIEQPFGEALPDSNTQDTLRRYEFVIIENSDDLKAYNNFASSVDVRKETEFPSGN